MYQRGIAPHQLPELLHDIGVGAEAIQRVGHLFKRLADRRRRAPGLRSNICHHLGGADFELSRGLVADVLGETGADLFFRDVRFFRHVERAEMRDRRQRRAEPTGLPDRS